MLHIVARFMRKAQQIESGYIDFIGDQKNVFAGSAEDTRECYSHLTIRNDAGRKTTFVIFQDEMPDNIKAGDYISFKTRDLGHDDYGSRFAVNDGSIKVLQSFMPVVKPERMRLVRSA